MSFQLSNASHTFKLFNLCLAMIVVTAMPVMAGSGSDTNDWPAFRGVRGDGISTTKVFSNRDNVGLKIAWKKTIGSGYSFVGFSYFVNRGSARAIRNCNEFCNSHVLLAFVRPWVAIRSAS